MRRRGLLNLLLLVLVVWMGFQSYSLWFSGSDGLTTMPKDLEKIATVQIPSPLRIMEQEKAYEAVMEKDLFRPERTRWQPPVVTPPPAQPAPPPPPPSPPPITLQGIVMVGNQRVALLNVVEKGTANQISVRAIVGDDVGGARVDAIEESRVVLQWNQKPILLHVHLQDGQKSTHEAIPEKLPLLLTKEEMERMQAKQDKKAGQQPISAPPVLASPEAVAKITGQPGAAAPTALTGAKEGPTPGSAPAQKKEEPPPKPAPPMAPIQRTPASLFAPRQR
jgi:hypothetical protein